MRKIVEVAAAVLLRPDGTFLLGQRPPETFYAGYWEFPGGKVERGESAHDALVRELDEELGIRVLRAYPWITREFVYPHAHVRLRFFRVVDWQGEIRDLNHTALAWQRSDAVNVEPMLPANAPILRALALPDFYGITSAGTVGTERQLGLLKQALEGGLRLVQLREAELTAAERESFYREAIRLARAFGARILINSEVQLARTLGADGVHLPSARLMETEARPDLPLVAASCHTSAELKRAAELELDFVVLGPLRETASHPGVPALGWEAFADWIRDYPLPVFALGGMTRQDEERAKSAGAHGIAAIRAAWDPPTR